MRTSPSLILFDLGGVIINLYPERTVESFSKLSAKSEEDILQLYRGHSLFEQFEVGSLTEAQFRAELKNLLNLEAVNNEQIDYAWNAMLADIPQDRIKQIEQLKKKYRIAVLSNTNVIHEKAFHQQLRNNHSLTHLNELFDAVYFSHEVKMRKPNVEIFDYVINQEAVNPKDVIFMDDTEEHLAGAEKVGIQALHIPRNLGFYNSLKAKLNL